METSFKPLSLIFVIVVSLLVYQLRVSNPTSAASNIQFKVGLGKADVTGPFGEINMMGYAKLSNTANGLHLRLFARAFIFASPTNPKNRVVYVSVEAGQISHQTKVTIINSLHEKLGSSLYTLENVMIGATHTHSGPGGYLDEVLYHVTSGGVINSQREAFSVGIVQAILQAHTDLEKSSLATVSLHKGTLKGTSVNRSPTSYMLNPQSERNSYEKNVDETMTLLNIKDSTGNLRGSVNWFAVHASSMNNTNLLVSSDNKGFASYLWETMEKAKGNKGYIAAFAQSNAGDVSPNTDGPKCMDTGLACDGSKGSCNGDITKCYALGPGSNMFESTKIIGESQFQKAKEISNEKGLEVNSDNIEFRHAWVDMTNIKLDVNGKQVKTCKPAMGVSFAAGTTDGPGTSFGEVFQGNSSLGTVFGVVRDILKKPSLEQELCQAPKVVLIDTGELNTPYRWQPHILPIQLFLIGSKVAIIGFPSEITTMAGRRLRKAVMDSLVKAKKLDSDGTVILSGLSNAYASYVTTFEEYQLQRYEAGSTIYGPHTLSAYIDQFSRLSNAFTTDVNHVGLNIVAQPAPIKNPIKCLSPNCLVVLDTVPFGKKFGSVIIQPQNAKIGDFIETVFQCAHPRNQEYQKSYITIERESGGVWSRVLGDSDWDTRFLWKRKGVSKSHCVVNWSIGETFPVLAGNYRIRYEGRHTAFGLLVKHSGTTNVFSVD